MDARERAWRNFQSKFAKLMNDLTKEEQKEFYYIFGLKKEIENNFDFENITALIRARVKEKKREKKRTKLLRNKIGIETENKHTIAVIQTSKICAKIIFKNKKSMSTIDTGLWNKIKQGLRGSMGCEFFPCD